jgi:diguanylate cyclase (GGDEF)-like protein
MKKSVIVISEKSEISPDLLTILCDSGMVVRPHGLAADAARDQEQSLLPAVAVIYQLPVKPDTTELPKLVKQLRLTWPDLPLIACAQTDLRHKDALREIIAQAGFDALADSPAQLPVLIREVEDRENDDDPRPFKAAREQLAFTLTDSLSKPKLRGAFALVASLHGAADQIEAASFAVSGLGRLIGAGHWTIFVTDESAGPAVKLQSLASRTFSGNETLAFDHKWHLELLESSSPSEEAASTAALEAVATASMVRRSEAGKRILATPLVSRERVIGVIEGFREAADRSFSAADARVLDAVASSIARALSNSVRIADAERLSLTDELTRLHNARYLRAFLVNEIKRARRYQTKVTALFLDLDDFKQVNDLYGHLAGSHCLMEVAALLLPSVRDTDCVVRYGGDEFVVILPEAGPEDAAIVAERIRSKIETHKFTGGRRLKISFTVSLGAAVFPDNALSPQQLISCADQAMYAAKAANKNCVRLAATAVTNLNPAGREGVPPRNQFQRIPDEKFIS